MGSPLKTRLPKVAWIWYWRVAHAQGQGLVVHGRGRHDLGGGHLLHWLQGLFFLGLINVRCRTSIVWYLQRLHIWIFMTVDFTGLGLWITFSLALICLSFLLAKTCMWDETCLRVLVFPVRNLMYLAISSFLPVKWGYQKSHYLINQVKDETPDYQVSVLWFFSFLNFFFYFWASCYRIPSNSELAEQSSVNRRIFRKQISSYKIGLEIGGIWISKLPLIWLGFLLIFF